MHPVSHRLPLLTAALAPWLIAALTAGCGSDGVKPPSAVQSNKATETLALASPPPPAGQSPAAPARALPAVSIPEGAKYTIVCGRFTGTAHVGEAQDTKDRLIAATGRRDFYLLHDEGQSTLYFGYYKAIEKEVDPVEAKRADDDWKLVRSLTDSTGHRLFGKSIKEPLPVPDPEGPAEYDLTRLDKDKAPNDPARRYWSIAIAAYNVDANPTGPDAGKSRKQLAVETVIEARKQGIEAYYYNGENVSTVCIGAWPRSAIAEQEAAAVGSQQNGDSSQDILVSPTPLPKSITDQIESSGKNIKIFQPKVDITDPTIINTFKQFPEYALNGAVQVDRITDPKTGQTTQRPQKSFLVEIPRLQPSLIGASQAPQDDASAPPSIINPLGPGAGGGQLKSLSK